MRLKEARVRFVETTSIQSKGKAAYDRRFSLPSQSGSLVCLGLPLVWLKGGLEGWLVILSSVKRSVVIMLAEERRGREKK